MDGQQGSDRAERAARNQALFREVNERLEELARTFADVAGTAVFTCECFDLSCVEQIDIPLAEYEAIRSHPHHFVVVGDHVIPEIENVVREGQGFVVVAKTGEAASVAVTINPRNERSSVPSQPS
jgi:hypothetical protein